MPPGFPFYSGQLPHSLNPLNLRHYLLLTYWIYFHPTAFKSYLYRADPETYRAGPGWSIFRTWHVPSYRNLYLMVPGEVMLLVIFIGLPLIAGANQFDNYLGEGDLIDWGRHIVTGMVIGIVVGLVFGVLCDVAGGVAGGVVVGVTVGVTGGLAGGVGGGVGPGFFGSMLFGCMFGIVMGVTVGVAGGVVVGIVGGIVLGMLVSIGLDVVGNAAGDRMAGIALGVGVALGILRIPLYPIELVWALYNYFRKRKSPVLQNMLVILPLPGTRSTLRRQLMRDEQVGLRFIADVASNVFQRWVAQAVLQTYLHKHEKPLHFFYTLLACPAMNVYSFAPVFELDWERILVTGRLLLGELGGQWIASNQTGENLIWILTRSLRDRRETPLTRFANMVYELLDEKVVEANNFDLTYYQDTYIALNNYPSGHEIACSFELMATFLRCNDLTDLPSMTAPAMLEELNLTEQTIRPAVLNTLIQLGEIAAQVAIYQASTSRTSQLTALARARDALNQLDEYVQKTQVLNPERAILRRIIRQWQGLMIEAGGEIGRAEEVGPVANPYVAGNPVSGDLFAGREEIMRRLEELWAGEGQWPSVVLYGHRRMGKTSILQNLGPRFGRRTVVVDFNMQRVGLVASSGELLYNLALALYDAQAGEIGEPEEERFLGHNPYTAFDRFLKALDRGREGRRFLVTVDEFELLEALVDEGQVEAHLLDFWRGLIQTYPWFVMAFAGLHTLQEMTYDYWHPLFGSVTAVPVSFLSQGAAQRLITQPSSNFPLDYDVEAVERIIALTHGQPYLIQLIGHGLVSRFNRQTFEAGVDRARRFSLEDVEAVISAPEFFRDGDAYFTGVWRQAKTGAAPGQTALLRTLAQAEAGLTSDQIAAQAGLSPAETGRALEELARHDIVMQTESGWRFTVELMRRWVKRF